MSTYWFKPKRYGYGATPVTWQGWALVGAAVAVIVAAADLFLGGHPPSPSALAAFFATGAAVLAVLWVIARRKTDGEFRWRWGDR
jgi:divalent metal cation (Fe/Co/Zn/Cd) transporter